MIVYFDNCVWRRRFDNTEDDKIIKQQNDILMLFTLKKEGKIKIASSDAVEAELMPLLDKNMSNKKEIIMEFINENSDIRFETAYNRLGDSKWARLGVMRLAKESVVNKVNELISFGFEHDDAVHIATAIDAKADIFVTVDEQVRNKSNNVSELKICFPSEVLQFFKF